jgi:glycerophosphoryl diester phosphodiesterase
MRITSSGERSAAPVAKTSRKTTHAVAKAPTPPRTATTTPGLKQKRVAAAEKIPEAKAAFRATVASGSARVAEKVKALAPLPGKPLVLAHRGMSDWLTDKELKKHRDVGNDMKSYREAIRNGASALEVDVRMTKDGVPVIYHDDKIFSDPKHRAIGDLTYEQVKKLRLSNGEKIPSLKQVLDLAKESGARLQVEIKDKPDRKWWGAKDFDPALDIVKRVDAALPKSKFQISSFHPDVLKKVEEFRPGIETAVWLTNNRLDSLGIQPTDGKAILKYASERGIDAVAVGRGVATQDFLEDAKKRGVRVYVGNVNTTEDMRRFANNKLVAGIVTEEPARARKAQRGA